MRHRPGRAPRAGFTLIELLVVVTIILLLIGLTLAGIGYARNSANQVQTTNDIRGLDAAITSFKTRFGFAPYSHLTEQASDGNYYVRQFRIPTNVTQREYAILNRMFPRWDPVNQGGVDASGNILAAFLPDHAGTVLDNNQAMVYFLAGPSNQGWHPAMPKAPSATGNTKIDPFFTFPIGDQLVAVSGNPIPRFHDHYGTPYAYFSGNTENDQYNPRAHYPWISTGTTRTFAGWGALEVAPLTYDPAADATATKTAHPVMSAGGKWQAPKMWQIISAGKDKKFGYGSPMLPSATAPAPYTAGLGDYQLKANGEDDLANFGNGILGNN